VRNKKSPACLAATGRNNRTTDETTETTEGSIPQSPHIGKLDRRPYQERSERRAALRLIGQRIVFYGPTTYRLGRVSLGLRNDVSFFDLDTATLMSLGRAMKEVLE